VAEGDSYIQIAAKEGNNPAYVNIMTGGIMNLQGATMNLTASSTMNLTSGDMYIDADGQIHMKSGADMDIESGATLTVESGGDINILGGADINILSSGKMNLLTGSSMLLGSGANMYIQSGGNMYIQSGGSIGLQAGSTFTVDSNNFVIDAHGNVLLKGTVYAWAGNIAGFTISGEPNQDGSGWIRQFIHTGNVSTVSAVGQGLYLGTDGLNIGGRMKYDLSKLTIEAESVIIGKQSSGSGTLLSMNAQTGEIKLLASNSIQFAANSSVNISAGQAVTIASTGSVVLGSLGSPFTIGSNGTNAYIYNGMTSLSDTTHNGIYVGTDGISLGKGLFKVTSSGALNATSATIKGSITALSGKIGAASDGTGGWSIETNQIYADNKAVVLCSTGDYRFFAGNATATNAAFYVKKDGTIRATKGTIGGWTINDYFLAHSSGKVGMYTKDASTNEISFWAGNATPAQAAFYVTAAGYLNATNVTVQGTVKATSLYINGTLASIALDGNGKITLASLDNDSNVNMNKAAKLILDGNNISAECLATIPDTKLNDKAQTAINKATKIAVDGTTGKILLSSLAESVVTEGGLAQTLTSYATIEMVPTKISALTWDQLSSSSIELTPSKIKIGTNGTFEVASNNFSISPEGNVVMKGTVESTAGQIGGWTIGERNLYSGANGTYVELNSDNKILSYVDNVPTYRSPYAFWIGAQKASDAPFRVKRDGSVYLTKVVVKQSDGTEREADLFNPNTYSFRRKGDGEVITSMSSTDDSFTISTTGNQSITVNFKKASSIAYAMVDGAPCGTVYDQNMKPLLSKNVSPYLLEPTGARRLVLTSTDSLPISTHTITVICKDGHESEISLDVNANAPYSRGYNKGKEDGAKGVTISSFTGSSSAGSVRVTVTLSNGVTETKVFEP
jgi:uncharacterized protein (DUF2345 family)